MTDAPQLDSAAAVEWGRFFFPGLEIAIRPDGTVRGRRKDYADADWTRPLVINDWDEIHRAAAVLVERGFKMQIGYQFKIEYAKSNQLESMLTLEEWIISAPADAWARAILATVREVSK